MNECRICGCPIKWYRVHCDECIEKMRYSLSRRTPGSACVNRACPHWKESVGGCYFKHDVNETCETRNDVSEKSDRSATAHKGGDTRCR